MNPFEEMLKGSKCVFEHEIDPTIFATQAQLVCLPLDASYVKSIHVDEVERVVVVRFHDNSKEIVKCGKNDEFDVAVGVALGIARHLFGSHAAFYKRVVAKKTQYTKRLPTEEISTEYALYCIWCKNNHKRVASEKTFKKNKNKYLAKMKGEK